MGLTPFRRIPPLTDRDVRRFWSKVQKTDGCWLWKGWARKRGGPGYGLFSITFTVPEYGSVTACHAAHRISYTLAVGPIPPRLDVLHSCDNPPCVNPSHLRVGSDLDNAADKIVRNRHPRGGRVPGVILPRQSLPAHYGEAHIFAKLSDSQVVAMRAEYFDGTSVSAKALARKYGTVLQNVLSILKGEARRSAGGPTGAIRPIVGERVPGAKLTSGKVAEIRRRYAPMGKGGDSGRTLAKEFGVTFQRISDIVRYNDWKHV